MMNIILTCIFLSLHYYPWVLPPLHYVIKFFPRGLEIPSQSDFTSLASTEIHPDVSEAWIICRSYGLYP